MDALRLPLERGPQPARLHAQQAQHERRPVEQEALELRAGNHETAEHRGRDDVRRRRLAGQRRDLAEEVTPPELRARLAAELDRRLALEDHVEVAAGEAATQDALAGRKDVLLVRVSDRLELRR